MCLVSYLVKSLSRVRLFASPWTVAHQAPPSMRFSRQEYWSELPFPFPGDLPDPGIKPRSPALQAGALTSEPPGKQTLLQMESFQDYMPFLTFSVPTHIMLVVPLIIMAAWLLDIGVTL